MQDTIFVDRIPNAVTWNEFGYQVTMHKENGLNKGETVLANLCGGNYGKALCAAVVKHAMESHMIENVIYSYSE